MSFSLIIMQNLVAFCRTMWALCPKTFLGALGPAVWIGVVSDPI